MPLREDILNPIAGENPSGRNLRSTPIYDKIREARREDEELPQGAWQIERKLADWALVISLCQEAIALQSKDLQLAAWLTEALLKKQSVRGLRDGIVLCSGLLVQFWDTLYPEIDEGDMEDRAAPLEWIGSKLDTTVKKLGLNREGHEYFKYKESRLVPPEDATKKEDKAAREKAAKEGKLMPEIFDRAFADTPKVFYSEMEKDADDALRELQALDKLCGEKFEDAAPAFNRLREAVTEFRHTVHTLLQKKRETEPDPVEEAPPPAPEEQGATDQASGEAAGEGQSSPGAATGTAPARMMFSMPATAEPADRREAIAQVAAAAALLRKKEPFSPAPYLMMRGLRWGELRASSDPSVLEAPPSDLRQQVKALAMQNKWAELLEWSETIMALPCSRAWLDLQRFVVEACTALGDDYNAIAIAIRSELRALLRDLPHLLDAALSDDTAAANAETQKWLKEIMAEPEQAASRPDPPKVPVMDNGQKPGWQKKFVDAHALALEAMRANQPQKAVTLLQREVERQLSGRGRFQRKLQLAQICIAAGKDAIAQPLLDDIAAAIEAHKLEEWEDRETVAAALVFLVQNSKKIGADAKAKQALFERICRLDPVQALSI
jgi:type VI secretion system protein ImpA